MTGAVHAPTATATATPTPDAPPPESCAVAPLGFDELNRIIEGNATPVAGFADADVVPAGPAAPPAVDRAVREVVREYVACQNAGELLRAYALYTDRYLARLFLRQGTWSEAAYLGLATPMPNEPGDRSAILAVENVRLLPDGRVGATVTLAFASIPMPKTFFFAFVQQGDRWAIDDILGEISFSVP